MVSWSSFTCQSHDSNENNKTFWWKWFCLLLLLFAFELRNLGSILLLHLPGVAKDTSHFQRHLGGSSTEIIRIL